ncbi:hypothetical protein V8F33_014214 [Rhypophila sp. PSN 637]
MAGNSRGKGRTTRGPSVTLDPDDVIENSQTQDTNTPPINTQTAFASMDPQQFQALMMQAMANFSSGLGNLGDTLANLTSQRTPYKDDRPPTYAVSKLQLDASFQEREDWLQAVEQGNATRCGRPEWLMVQWASTWMESETQQQWRAYQQQLHDGDFEQIQWKEFKDYVSSDYLGSNSREMQAQKDWMACTQRGRSPQEFYREWAALVRRLLDAKVDSIFMARDYWIKLDRFYHSRYAEAVPNVTSAKDCAEWCERIWLARAPSRNGLERDAHRKRPRSPVSLYDARKLSRTQESSFSGPRHDKARIVQREHRHTDSRLLNQGSTNTSTAPVAQQTTPPDNRPKDDMKCYGCDKLGHIQQHYPNSNPTPTARI